MNAFLEWEGGREGGEGEGGRGLAYFQGSIAVHVNLGVSLTSFFLSFHLSLPICPAQLPVQWLHVTMAFHCPEIYLPFSLDTYFCNTRSSCDIYNCNTVFRKVIFSEVHVCHWIIIPEYSFDNG